MGEHAGVVAEQRGAQRTHVPVRGKVLVLDRLRLARQRRRIRASRERTLHPVQRPHQVHCGGTRGAEARDRFP